jgi:hypothetical protein
MRNWSALNQLGAGGHSVFTADSRVALGGCLPDLENKNIRCLVKFEFHIQEDLKFKAYLGLIARLCLKKHPK